MTEGPAKSNESFDGRSNPDGCIVRDPARREVSLPKFRTPELVALEMALVRDQLDLYVETERLRLAGECCVELDQLQSELARLQDPIFKHSSRKASGTMVDDARGVVDSSGRAADHAARVDSPDSRPTQARPYHPVTQRSQGTFDHPLRA
jgi:hypothetical protein